MDIFNAIKRALRGQRRYAKRDGWVTLNANSGDSGDGGTPVYLEGGTITKGPQNLAGKDIGKLRKPSRVSRLRGRKRRHSRSDDSLHAAIKQALCPQPARYEKFEEDKHPRDDDGKFTSGGGAGKSTATSKSKSKSKATGRDTLKDSKRSGTGTASFVMFRDGSQVPEKYRELRIPPKWTNVRIYTDPNADLQATGVDAKGRTQPIYSKDFTMRQAAKKFRRIRDLQRRVPHIDDQLAADRESEDPRIRDAASVLSLIRAYGLRPGSKRDTGAKTQAYGATTLRSEHVHIDNTGVRLKFIGKKGVPLDIPITDRAIAADLSERAKTPGPLFKTSDAALRKYTKSVAGADFKTKDFRTLKGTALALEAVEKSGDCCGTMKDYKARVTQVARVVSRALGNQPEVALQSYIDPTVFSRWSKPDE